ncbi:diaminopropionate ammonia-lyase [Neisseria sp. HSC-16F19]|nr:diaminopropionate ammonia-lyase [Neisseria sp. HSC-16F19]MCP2041848.1 diaminopropionate ammonia-lyase [Neisseria sp. HSC-16F19]
MSRPISLLFNPNIKTHGSTVHGIDADTAATAQAFHRSLPGYAPTPLHALPALSRHLGLGAVMVKDESQRFGLNAFKGLGASFAVARALAQHLGLADTQADFATLQQAAAEGCLKDVTLITATDGNHGRGIAWAAQQLGVRAVVLMPKGSSELRAGHIRNHGAECTITEVNYDDTVRRAAALAEEHGWLLVQDTAWSGYETVPLWIMQGYTTLVAEAAAQWDAPPTHVFLQAGVGSFAAAVAACLHALLGDACPKIVIVEAEQAACYHRSMSANDGQAHAVGGDMSTIMAGLACGEVSTLAWPFLRDHSTAFAAVADCVSAEGMRVLAAPKPGTDPAILSGESGAVGLGLLYALCSRPAYAAERAQLQLDDKARVLCINTEGDTAPDVYEAVVWRGYQGHS